MDSCPFFSELLYFCHFLDSWFELEPVLDLSLVFFLASWTRSTLSFCSLASFVEKTSYSRFSFRYFISIQRCFGYKYTHYWLRSDFTSSSFTMPLLKLRCAGLFRLRNVVIEIVGVFAFIKGKQADFHQRCECVITKTYATVNARTKSMLYFTSYQTYRKSQNHVVCRSFYSCESVGIWSKNGDCHCTLWCLSSIHHWRMLPLSSCSSVLNGFKYLDQCFCQTVIYVPELQHV